MFCARPEMLDAVRCIRAEGIKTALLTNNWKWDDSPKTLLPVDTSLFDVVCNVPSSFCSGNISVKLLL